MCSQKPGQRELGQENVVGAAKSRFGRFHSHSSAIECMWGNIRRAYETAALSNWATGNCLFSVVFVSWSTWF